MAFDGYGRYNFARSEVSPQSIFLFSYPSEFFYMQLKSDSEIYEIYLRQQVGTNK